MTVDKSYKYEDGGCHAVIDINIPYDELKVVEFPLSCDRCPVGFMDHGCGRNVPFTDEDYKHRPDTCKLQKISIEEIMNMTHKEGVFRHDKSR